MKKVDMKWIMILVAAALLVLITVQLYWIQNAYIFRKNQHNEKVKQVLSAAAKQTVDNATCFELFGKVFIKPHEGIYFARQPWSGSQVFTDPATKAPDSVKMFFLNREQSSIIGQNSLKFTHPVSAEFTMRMEYHFDDTSNAAFMKPENRNPDALNYSDYREVINGNAPIGKRLDLKFLDSVLKYQVMAAGLGMDYHFGIVRSDNGALEYASPNADYAKLTQSEMSAGLIADNYFSHPYKLVIYFDSGITGALAALWGVLLASAFVILLLCYGFWYFIRTIISQKKLSEMKTDFINNMTHEFKTPITNIGLAVENINEKGDLNGSTPFLRIIGEENNRLRENVERILQIATLDKEEIHLKLDKIDINNLVEKICQNMELSAYPGNPETEYQLLAENSMIWADETHIINIIYNLLDNSVKYCNEKPLIKITTINTSGGVKIIVKDNGIGMNKETQKRAFEKFYRAHTGNIHNVKGFGLGLSYVKKLVELHSGIITLWSEPGKGSIFEIFLPFNYHQQPLETNG
jgi:two-component system, OmpR family, phosphate regulon sensor histidine kinase PhoR